MSNENTASRGVGSTGGSACPICAGAMWVCERHQDTPWRDGCPKCGGAGMNCECNPSGDFPLGVLIIASRDDYSKN